MKAEGGEVTAASEKRPMPSQTANDSRMVKMNSGDKAPMMDGWTDRPDMVSQKAKKLQPIKHPAMPALPGARVRRSDSLEEMMREDEARLMEMEPASPKEEPKKAYDEMDAASEGPSTPSLKMKKMAEGGRINEVVSIKDADEDMEPAVHDPMDSEMSDEHAMDDHMQMLAEGGSASDEDEMEHAASIAAAIMAKRKMMARGGAILSEDSMESDDSDQADLSRNAEEDANMEDKASFDALRKETYSESDTLSKMDQPEDSNEHSPEHGKEDVDDADIVSAIRRKMRMKSAITR
jgi:hypothetical protein